MSDFAAQVVSTRYESMDETEELPAKAYSSRSASPTVSMTDSVELPKSKNFRLVEDAPEHTPERAESPTARDNEEDDDDEEEEDDGFEDCRSDTSAVASVYEDAMSQDDEDDDCNGGRSLSRVLGRPDRSSFTLPVASSLYCGVKHLWAWSKAQPWLGPLVVRPAERVAKDAVLDVDAHVVVPALRIVDDAVSQVAWWIVNALPGPLQKAVRGTVEDISSALKSVCQVETEGEDKISHDEGYTAEQEGNFVGNTLNSS